MTNSTLALALVSTFAAVAMDTTAFADPADPYPPAAEPSCDPCRPVRPALAASADPQSSSAAPAEPAPIKADDGVEEGWHTPVGRRFFHGFRLGWTYIAHWDTSVMSRGGKSIKEEFGLKSPNMMLLGYEGFYRIVGHSWLNVLMVGNVTVAGLEQSKFIPAASGLIGFEIDKNFQIGVGVNLTPDPEAPSHMIIAGGWTPHVGSIQTPIHFFFVPDTDGNNRMGATIGMNW